MWTFFHFALLHVFNSIDMAWIWTCNAWIKPWITKCLDWEDMSDPYSLLPLWEKAVLSSSEWSNTVWQWLLLHFLAGNMKKNIYGKCVCVCVCVWWGLSLKWFFYLWASRIERYNHSSSGFKLGLQSLFSTRFFSYSSNEVQSNKTE